MQKRYLNFLFLLLLVGCAELPVQQKQIMNWQQSAVNLNQLSKWSITGAISIKQNNKGHMANLVWQQQDAHYQINLSGPLGLGSIRIIGQPGSVTLWQSAQPVSASSPEILMQEQLGWSLPVSNLYYWIRGLPAPNYPHQLVFASNGDLMQLQQQNWVIHYLRFTAVNNLLLPSKLELDNGALSAMIVISHWNLFK